MLPGSLAPLLSPFRAGRRERSRAGLFFRFFFPVFEASRALPTLDRPTVGRPFSVIRLSFLSLLSVHNTPWLFLFLFFYSRAPCQPARGPFLVSSFFFLLPHVETLEQPRGPLSPLFSFPPLLGGKWKGGPFFPGLPFLPPSWHLMEKSEKKLPFSLTSFPSVSPKRNLTGRGIRPILFLEAIPFSSPPSPPKKNGVR